MDVADLMSQVETSSLKDVAKENMLSNVRTLEVTQVVKFLLKEEACRNILTMDVADL
eukprot:CAMPEP_0118711382 /NCGR_PEP_ID=MMETSP0800-20121206/24049_1 /TAXON_ID=210618 ORGANISM="Striatella unipunctata, Strain CCMP2910" /NCGR_SAMPLE_ID=MMETSP0800 /ASSEMBLY_ACC=CAM_ASM_000638 /LENGTH=56 /DNA_ID=CAMNT_0006615955 /DNA_START=66 /DNA_END=233 /DNA_ORIENTATION=+